MTINSNKELYHALITLQSQITGAISDLQTLAPYIRDDDDAINNYIKSVKTLRNLGFENLEEILGYVKSKEQSTLDRMDTEMHDDQTHDNDTRTRSSTPPVPTPTSPSSTSTSQGPRSPPPPASSTGYSTTSPELQRIHKGALKMGDLKDWITNVFYNGDTRHAAILIKRMKDHIKEICQQERRNLDPGYNMTWGDLEERRRKSMILDLENRCAADGLHLEWAKDHWAAKWLLYQKFNADHYNKTKNKETEAQPSTAAATADSGADDDHDMMDAEPDG